MMSALAILAVALSSPVEKPGFSRMSEQDLAVSFGPLTANIESSKSEATEPFWEAAAAWATMLSAPKQGSPENGRWLVRYQPQTHVDMIRSAENRESALSVVVRHKEQVN